MYEHYKASRFNTVVNIDDDNRLIYNSLSQGFSLLNGDETDVYERVRNAATGPIPKEDRNTIDHLLVNNFLVPSDIDELEVFKKQYLKERQRTDNMGLTILPTLNCNFGCAYCFEGDEKSTVLMPENIQHSIFRLLEKKAETIKSLNITWFGGEPLIGLNIIKKLSNRIIPYCDTRGIAYFASMITNGYLLTDEVVAELYLRKVRTIQITLDGAEPLHDRSRFLKTTGTGTYRKIIDNIKGYIHKYPLKTIIRINMDRKNLDSIYGLLDDLAEQGLGHTGRLSVYFSPIEASTRACGKIVDDVIQMRVFAAHEFDLYKYAVAKGLCDIGLPYRNVGICTATRPNGLVILPNGDLHRCWETVSDGTKQIGLLGNGDDLTKNPLEAKWSSWSPFEQEECRNCAILPNCAGYCAYRFIYNTEFHGEFSTPCPALKYNIKDKLLYYVASKDAAIAKLLLMNEMKGGEQAS
ncbi:SPASM domain-containing protein [Heliobacterium undosum]|uniref:SPASM domain-containing protein n=1 Tax=Heliomicrobium undosum TaxID=121734 RepID=A0A845L5W3_9FIRM|nr:radical SAM protein [Heliomicrobium undosum]MZP28321.1 SPASM domain-containing protein [Heliomicrobium undosum]